MIRGGSLALADDLPASLAHGLPGLGVRQELPDQLHGMICNPECAPIGQGRYHLLEVLVPGADERRDPQCRRFNGIRAAERHETAADDGHIGEGIGLGEFSHGIQEKKVTGKCGRIPRSVPRPTGGA